MSTGTLTKETASTKKLRIQDVTAEPIVMILDQAQPNIDVQIEHGTQVTLFLRLQSKSHSINVMIDDDATAECICLQDAGDDQSISIEQKSTLGKNANVHWRNITLGSKRVLHDLVSHIKGTDSKSSVDWIFYSKNREKHQLRARNTFDAERGRGEIRMHGVAEDHAHAICEGMIEITGKGSGTDTYLTEKTLMLDASAKVDAVPGLEIKTNDVKASHSATVTKVSPEDLFYFASRGVEKKEARRMYIEGFLNDLVQNISDKNIREVVLQEIAKRYAHS
jgi:Fe-S cluster assembly scaffold protein SufB